MPSEALTKLLEERKQAHDAYEQYVQPLIAEKRGLTDDENTRRGELRAQVEKLDERIDEVDAEESRAQRLQEARERAGITKVDASVTHEARTYEKGSPNSWIADLIQASSPAWSDHQGAQERLARHEYETAREIANGSKEGQRAEQMFLNSRRAGSPAETRAALGQLRDRGREEFRTGMTTGSGSGGAFAVPVYLLDEYAPYRQAGRAFADQANKHDLPPYGMTVYVPAVSGPAGVAVQATQNTQVQETDPTAGYISTGINTLAGEVTISQQLLDRAGPGFSFDKLIWDQLQRAYNPQVDAQVLTAALASATAVAFTAGSFTLTTASGAGGFYSKVSGAKAGMRTAAGVFLDPTHLFVQPARWELIAAFADAQGRPLVVPAYAGPMNAAAAGNGNGDAGIEGATGYRFNGLPVYQDANIPTPGTGADQALVADMREVFLFEGNPVTRVLPQTLGNQLSVILQMFSYVATLVRYPAAVAAISGTGMATIAF